MKAFLRIAVADDHPSIIDGYRYRLTDHRKVRIVATATDGQALEVMLENFQIDVLILDLGLPVSPTNPNPYPTVTSIPGWLQRYPQLSILIISMYVERSAIRAALQTGASGYILKGDQRALREMGSIITSIAAGGKYFSPQVKTALSDDDPPRPLLTRRQLQALSLFIAEPEISTATAAERMGIAHSTLRNILSRAYKNLDVRNLTAALAEMHRLGLVSSPPSLDFGDGT